MRVAKRRIIGGGAVHVDDATRVGDELIAFDDSDIFKRTRLTVANETIRIERAGKIKSIQPISRLDNVEHT